MKSKKLLPLLFFATVSFTAKAQIKTALPPSKLTSPGVVNSINPQPIPPKIATTSSTTSKAQIQSSKTGAKKTDNRNNKNNSQQNSKEKVETIKNNND